ncbi:type VI secretion system baseplate subunit TssK [Candidatus Poribacteria bacterium]|nr:type VI secretion system baseplate subunit TssK [Candidatus Poribacteria bacterium]
MARFNKIVWNEGMFLGPHHFQQLELYHEGLLNFRFISSMPFHWGVTALEIDREALGNGNFILSSCRGVFSDGSRIDIPGTDEAPASRSIEEHFEPSLETLEAYLAIPTYRVGSANCKLEESDRSSITRYIRDYVKVVDENTGNNEQEISIARKNLKILFSDETLDGHDSIKIAEIQRTPNGTAALRDNYIPPCININASQALIGIVRRLTQLLTARSDDFRRHCRERGDGFYEFGTSDLTNFWLFQIINSVISELNHFYNTGRVHPEDLFRVLIRFAGAMTVFSVNIRPVDLPVYDHENLSDTFQRLNQIIQELLQIIGPTTKCKQIPLRKIQESIEGSIYESILESNLVSPSNKFYLALKADLDQEMLIDEAERRMKIAASERISFLIGQAVRGIRLSFLRNPPSDIRTKAGFLYFALAPQSNYWDEVWTSKRLAIYVPPSSKNVELELIACEE